MDKRKGLTLPELVIALTVISLLAVIFVPKIMLYSESARLAAFEANHNVLKYAISKFMAENGDVPEDIEDLLPYIADETSNPSSFFFEKPKDSRYELNEHGTLTSTLLNVKVEIVNQSERKGSLSGTTYTIVYKP